jgi:outer membrane protein
MRDRRVTYLAVTLLAACAGSWSLPATAVAEQDSTVETAPAEEVAAPPAEATEPATGAAPEATPPVHREGYVAETAGGKAVVDTEASARRQAELEKTPYMPEVFIHQWSYHEPPIALPKPPPDQTEVAELTLVDAVQQALQNNPGISAQRLTPLLNREQVREAEATFDPLFSVSATRRHREAPNPTALNGQVLTSIASNFDGEAKLEKTLRTGADFSVSLTTNRLSANNTFLSLRPQYTTELLFSLNQPLLRNFGKNFAYLLVDVTELNSEVARFQYRAALADFVRQVIEAYWTVVYARQNLVVQQQSHELALQTLRENGERVRVGLLAPVAVKEAESQAAAREEQVIVASNQLDNARSALRQIVYMGAKEGLMPRQVEPVEQPHTQPVDVDIDRALGLALENRPEIVAQNYDLRSKQLTERIRENQLLPKFDLVANGGFNALSGTPREVTFQGQTFVSPFGGSYADAFDRLGRTQYYSYEAGVQIEIPIGNAAAKSQYAQAKIDVAQTQLTRRQLLSDITQEVRQAVNDVTTNAKRIDTTRVARELAEENLRNQQKRLEVGMATTKDVLDFQDDLTQARGNELKAAIDYNVSLAALSRAIGSILDRFSVVIEEPGKRFVPWWAQF